MNLIDLGLSSATGLLVAAPATAFAGNMGWTLTASIAGRSLGPLARGAAVNVPTRGAVSGAWKTGLRFSSNPDMGC